MWSESACTMYACGGACHIPVMEGQVWRRLEVAHQWCHLQHYVPTFDLDMWAFGLLLVALWGGNMPGSMTSNCTQYLSNLVQADEQLLHKVRLVEPPRL